MTDHRTLSQRCADQVTEFCGSWTFVLVFSLFCGLWIFDQRFTAFDPYPFIALNLVLTVVSTFQSPLIMMSQNRQVERDREIVQGLHEKFDRIIARLEAADNFAPGNSEWRRS